MFATTRPYAGSNCPSLVKRVTPVPSIATIFPPGARLISGETGAMSPNVGSATPPLPKLDTNSPSCFRRRIFPPITVSSVPSASTSRSVTGEFRAAADDHFAAAAESGIDRARGRELGNDLLRRRLIVQPDGKEASVGRAIDRARSHGYPGAKFAERRVHLISRVEANHARVRDRQHFPIALHREFTDRADPQRTRTRSTRIRQR